jgi:hypothetical protein
MFHEMESPSRVGRQETFTMFSCGHSRSMRPRFLRRCTQDDLAGERDRARADRRRNPGPHRMASHS